MTSAGGSVIAGTGFRAVTDVAGASGPAGTGAGGPVVTGMQFLAVAEVYAPFEETEGDLQGDSGEVDQNSKIHGYPGQGLCSTDVECSASSDGAGFGTGSPPPSIFASTKKSGTV